MKYLKLISNWFLMREYTIHVTTWHYHDKCIFCHMAPIESARFIANLKK